MATISTSLGLPFLFTQAGTAAVGSFVYPIVTVPQGQQLELSSFNIGTDGSNSIALITLCLDGTDTYLRGIYNLVPTGGTYVPTTMAGSANQVQQMITSNRIVLTPGVWSARVTYSNGGAYGYFMSGQYKQS